MNLLDLVEVVRKVTKDFLNTAGDQIYPEVIENMGADIGAGPFRDAESGALSLRAPRNRTKNLRFQTNKLGRALVVGEPGNYFKVTTDGDTYEVDYGIDLDVVPYARIHELGGTIKHPGGTPYKVIGGRTVFVSKREGADLPRTAPHDIKIPARPYLGPGYKAWSKVALLRLGARISKALKEMK
jgi:phage gpG-like protein